MILSMVTHRFVNNDGQGRVNLEIAREALRRRHSLRLYCEEADPSLASDPRVECVVLPPPRWLPSRLLRDQIFAHRSARRIDRARAPGVVMLANGFVTWARAEVNVVHFVHSAFLAAPDPAVSGRRSLSWFYGRLYGLVNTWLERHAFGRAGILVAVSQKLANDLRAAGMGRDTTKTIVNGVDTSEFAPGNDARDTFGLPKDQVIALFAGDLKTSRKNLDTVLSALQAAPGLHLAVAGRHEGTRWPELAARLGVADRTHFLGFQRDMSALMRSVDFFVFPSRYEACSLVLLEALASGLPVITAASAGGAELVTPAAGIVLQDSEDSAGLAASLRQLGNDNSLRATMGRAARAIALQHGWADMAANYVTLIEEIAAKKSPSVETTRPSTAFPAAAARQTVSSDA